MFSSVPPGAFPRLHSLHPARTRLSAPLFSFSFLPASATLHSLSSHLTFHCLRDLTVVYTRLPVTRTHGGRRSHLRVSASPRHHHVTFSPTILTYLPAFPTPVIPPQAVVFITCHLLPISLAPGAPPLRFTSFLSCVYISSRDVCGAFRTYSLALCALIAYSNASHLCCISANISSLAPLSLKRVSRQE